MEAVVIASIVETIGTITSSTIAAVIIGYFGKRWIDQQKVKEQLQEAREDIEFLLQIEKYYTEETKDDENVHGKNKAREYIKNLGYKWSGKNTPGRVRNETL